MAIITKYTIFILKIICFFMFHVKHYVAGLE
ncbi:unknown [Ruminococcus sp. CAG:9]|nr:unknown [Ruminococcus sp. CAG:9]